MAHRRLRPPVHGVLLALTLLVSGYSSCTTGTGPLFVPLMITPHEVLLRASLASGQEAVGLARIEGGDGNDRFEATVGYEKSPPVEWLRIELSGTELTLHARPNGLDEGTYVATVTVKEEQSGTTASLRVEFSVIK